MLCLRAILSMFYLYNEISISKASTALWISTYVTYKQ
jgi:hypothetical protein